MEAGKQQHAAWLVVDVGRVNLGLQQIALGIDQDLPLSARHLLATIIAARSTSFGSLDRLAVDHRRGGVRLASLSDPMTLSQDLIDPLPGSFPAPRAQVLVNILPRRQIVRHHAPGNTASQNIEAAIDDPP